MLQNFRSFFRHISTRSLENSHFFKYLPTLEKKFETKELKNVPSFENLDKKLSENYNINSGKNSRDVVEVFCEAQKFLSTKQIVLNEKRFNNLIDGLVDHCENLTDSELLTLLKSLSRVSEVKNGLDKLCGKEVMSVGEENAGSYQENRNFDDVWSCLDDVCCARIKHGDYDFLLALALCWYEWNLAKVCDFTGKLLDHLTKKSEKLTRNQLVHCFFLHNVSRRKKIPFEFEDRLSQIIEDLRIEEIGIVALGYFKTMSRIKIDKIASVMLTKLEENVDVVDQVTLCAILKVMRYSKPVNLIPDLNRILDKLTWKIPDMTPQCCLHVAILGSSMIYCHEKSMDAAAKKLVGLMDDVTKVRLKDIERIINATTMVNHRPAFEPDLYTTVFQEIQQERRRPELEKHPKILPSILNYLTFPGLHSKSLLDKVLSEEYLHETYGKSMGNYPRDIFHLDCSVELDFPEYSGNRLNYLMKKKLVKWNLEYTPFRGQQYKLSNYDKLFLETLDTVRAFVENPKLSTTNWVAPHFPRADIILRRDAQTGKFIEPVGLEKYELGDLKRVENLENGIWYALTVVGWNQTVRNSTQPVGLIKVKQRHLEKLGYVSRLVIWNELLKLNDVGKRKYIKNLLEN